MSSFAAAYAAHAAGQLAEAERGYRAALAGDPRHHADAWHLLGVLAQQQGRSQEATELIGRAVEIAGPQPAYLSNLGIALQSLGRHEDTLTALNQARLREPTFGTLFALGNSLRALQRLNEAEARYREALVLQPENASVYNNLGSTLEDQGRVDEAAEAYRRTIALNPGHPRAHYSLGMLYKRRGDLPRAAGVLKEAVRLRPDDTVLRNNLANILLALNRPGEAEAHLRAALQAVPSMPETHFHLGNVLKAQDRLPEAVSAYETALNLRPGFFKARINLGGVLTRLGDYSRALASFDAGVEADPMLGELWSGRGVALQALGRHDAALASFERARELKPDLAEAQRNAGLALLLQEDYRRGWEAYDWRWKAEGHAPRPFSQTQWRGEAGGGIVLWGEQGLGDKVLYAGMIPDLIARGHDVIYETDPRLFKLFERSFPGLKAVPESNPPHPMTVNMQWHSSLASLGRWLRADVSDFPERPYLKPDPVRRAAFRKQLGGRGLIVGISWASTNPKIGRHKSSALKQWLPLLKTPGVHFVDLQYGDTAKERAEPGVNITHIEGLDLREDVDGVVALAAACDLVIAVSSTTVHLAAGVGVPTWVLVPEAAGSLWYWGRNGEHTPWYPNVRIIRQEKTDEWDAPIAEAARRLAAQLA